MTRDELTTDRDELTRARMRRDARELVEAVEEFEDTHSEVFSLEEEHSWNQALSAFEEVQVRVM